MPSLCRWSSCLGVYLVHMGINVVCTWRILHIWGWKKNTSQYKSPACLPKWKMKLVLGKRINYPTSPESMKYWLVDVPQRIRPYYFIVSQYSLHEASDYSSPFLGTMMVSNPVPSPPETNMTMTMKHPAFEEVFPIEHGDSNVMLVFRGRSSK